MENLSTNAKNTWCPGCGNFGILAATKQAFNELEEKGIKKEDIAITGGIGCHAKIIDYLNVNSFYSLHGRPIPPASGIKLANDNLKVLAFGGDGDTYNEGISHLIHAAKRNTDITVVVHENRNFALTTGQFTGTSPEGFKGGSTPEGSVEEPFNPLALMMASEASYIARGYSSDINQLKELLVGAIEHEGFSYVEVLQPCVIWLDTTEDYREKVYKLEDHDPTDKEAAEKKIKEWDYHNDAKIPTGLFYKEDREVFEKELYRGHKLGDHLKEDKTKEILKVLE